MAPNSSTITTGATHPGRPPPPGSAGSDDAGATDSLGDADPDPDSVAVAVGASDAEGLGLAEWLFALALGDVEDVAGVERVEGAERVEDADEGWPACCDACADGLACVGLGEWVGVGLALGWGAGL